MTVIQKKCFLRQSFKKDPFYILNSAELLEISNIFIGMHKISFTGWESLEIIFDMRNKDKKRIFQKVRNFLQGMLNQWKTIQI